MDPVLRVDTFKEVACTRVEIHMKNGYVFKSLFSNQDFEDGKAEWWVRCITSQADELIRSRH